MGRGRLYHAAASLLALSAGAAGLSCSEQTEAQCAILGFCRWSVHPARGVPECVEGGAVSPYAEIERWVSPEGCAGSPRAFSRTTIALGACAPLNATAWAIFAGPCRYDAPVAADIYADDACQRRVGRRSVHMTACVAQAEGAVTYLCKDRDESDEEAGGGRGPCGKYARWACPGRVEDGFRCLWSEKAQACESMPTTPLPMPGGGCSKGLHLASSGCGSLRPNLRPEQPQPGPHITDITDITDFTVAPTPPVPVFPTASPPFIRPPSPHRRLIRMPLHPSVYRKEDRAAGDHMFFAPWKVAVVATLAGLVVTSTLVSYLIARRSEQRRRLYEGAGESWGKDRRGSNGWRAAANVSFTEGQEAPQEDAKKAGKKGSMVTTTV
eukprot:TRINITY_DN25118_c0_g1_i1.p1 TRINITY_DN25118_c0_g1~~TRINITY_DN25118_c0_g1_i1.p1  ORF type:complete len:382 (+),score=52.34 TRINITY_DN25118_c0_g1_i1:75-1220(+)